MILKKLIILSLVRDNVMLVLKFYNKKVVVRLKINKFAV